MANRQPNNLPKLPNILELNPNQLTKAQANELLNNKPMLRTNDVSQVPQGLNNASDMTPMQRYNLAQIIGLPDNYKPTPYQSDPNVIARAQQVANLLANYNPSFEGLQQQRAKDLENEYFAKAVGATPVKTKSDYDLRKQSINDIYDIYTKQKSMEQASNEQAQLSQLSEALGIPIDSMEHFYKNVMNPSLTAYSQFSNQQMRGQQQQDLENTRQQGRIEEEQYKQNLPSEQLNNLYKSTSIQKMMHDMSQPTPAQQKAQEAQQKQTQLTKQNLSDIDYATNLVKNNPELVGTYAPFRTNVGRLFGGNFTGFNKKQLQTRGEISRTIGVIKNGLIAQARANGQTGINTMAEINQATAGIDENSSQAELLGALKAMKNIAQRNAGMSAPKQSGLVEGQTGTYNGRKVIVRGGKWQYQ